MAQEFRHRGCPTAHRSQDTRDRCRKGAGQEPGVPRKTRGLSHSVEPDTSRLAATTPRSRTEPSSPQASAFFGAGSVTAAPSGPQSLGGSRSEPKPFVPSKARAVGWGVFAMSFTYGAFSGLFTADNYTFGGLIGGAIIVLIAVACWSRTVRHWNGAVALQIPSPPIVTPPGLLQPYADDAADGVRSPRVADEQRRTRELRPWTVPAAVGLCLLLAVLNAISGKEPVSQAAKSPPASSVASTTTSPTPSSPAPSATRVSASSSSASPRPATALVPDLRGMSEREARRALTALGLVVGTVETKLSLKPVGTVLSQGIRTGQVVALRTRVDVILAKSLPKTPSVAGMSRGSAISALEKAGFTVKVVTSRVARGADGAVLSQSPAAGTRLKPGDRVRIVVADVVRPVAPPPSKPVPLAGSGGSCTPGYSPCLPPASDYDCAGGSGNGPEYTGRVRVTGSDPYDLDRDNDGWGCESS